ncbi:MAG: hypothetical protein U1E02_33460, partial [Hydrogenophaga sp.]|nr:hypothetical protein [Hydrogenophaga sp.]
MPLSVDFVATADALIGLLQGGLQVLSMVHPGLIFLLTWVLGVALQLQQAALWHLGVYAGLLLASGLLLFGLVWLMRLRRLASRARFPAQPLFVAALLSGLLAGVGLTGLRAAHFAAQAMPHHLQGLDLVVTGRVASLPRR